MDRILLIPIGQRQNTDSESEGEKITWGSRSCACMCTSSRALHLCICIAEGAWKSADTAKECASHCTALFLIGLPRVFWKKYRSADLALCCVSDTLDHDNPLRSILKVKLAEDRNGRTSPTIFSREGINIVVVVCQDVPLKPR